MKRKITAMLLALCMVLQMFGISAAATQESGAQSQTPDASSSVESQTPDETVDNLGEDVFVFSAAKYVLSESDEGYDVIVERTGNAEAPAEVVFKAIDTMAVYGEDYTISYGDGAAPEKAEGTVLSQSDMLRLAAAQKAQVEEEPEETTQPDNDLLETRNVLLGIEDGSEKTDEQIAADEVQTAMTELNTQLFEAAGVSGVLHFDAGERERQITIVPVDNAVGAADKTLLLALLSTTEGSIAPNATSSVVIMDDEPYDPPVFEMEQNRVTLSADNPKTELVIRRLSGDNYYSTVLVSTYSMTAQREIDFTPLDNHQVVFAPGEMEKTVLVEALDFSYTGDFGVRLVDDGSCEIGETDRTIVHIAGELSQARKPEEPEETRHAAADDTPQANAQATPAAEEVWDGILGSQVLHARDEDDLKIQAWDRYADTLFTAKLNEEITMGYYQNECVSVNCNTGVNGALFGIGQRVHIPPANVEKSSILFSVKLLQNGYNMPQAKVRVEHPNNQKTDIVLTNDWQDVRYEHTSISTGYEPYRFMLQNYYSYNAAAIKIKDIYFTFSKPIGFEIAAAPKIGNVPYIEMLAGGGTGSTITVNYQPPALRVETDDGKPVDAFYPCNETIHITSDLEDLQSRGMYLAGVLISPNPQADNTLAYIFQHPEKADQRPDVVYLNSDSLRFSCMDLLKMFQGSAARSKYYIYPDYRTSNVNIHLEKTEDGTSFNISADKENGFATQTGAMVNGSGRPADGTAITGYAVYGENKKTGSPRTLIGVHRNPEDTSILGEMKHPFYVPSAPYALTDVYIVPLTEFQGLTVKPHPSTSGETIIDPDTGEEITYAGRAYLNGAFNDGGNALAADQNGQVYVDRISSNSVVTLRSIAPEGYITEWVNGTMDFDEDGVIDNENASGMSQSKVAMLVTSIQSIVVWI